MKSKLTLVLLGSIIFFKSQATIYYTASPSAALINNGAASFNFTTNPNGVTGLYNPIITENDEIVLLANAHVNVEGITINKLTVNGNSTLAGTGQLIIRLTTTLNAGILTIDDVEVQFGDGDNNSSAGKILGNPNGTTIGINAYSFDNFITFRGGGFAAYAPANLITLPPGTFINNTLNYLEINMFSVYGQYQVELNTALTVLQALLLSKGALKTSADVNKKFIIGVDAFSSDGFYNNATDYTYVTGNMYVQTNSASFYYFPIGSASKYKPVILQPSNNTPSLYFAGYEDYELAENNPLYLQPKCAASNLISVRAGEQYNIGRVGAGANAKITLQYFQSSGFTWSGNTAPGPQHKVVIAHYNTTLNCRERASTATSDYNSDGSLLLSNELTSFSPFTFGYGLTSILPLQLLQFSATAKNNYNLLQWQTASQINTKHFEVEYSNDGLSFKYAGKEIAKTLGDFRYAFSHNIPLGVGDVIFYRLKIVDSDGIFSYSEIVKVLLQKNNELVVYPNPATDFININNVKVGNVIQIINAVRAVILQEKVVSNNIRIDVSGFAKGVYLVRVVNVDGSRETEQFVKE